MNSGLAKSIRDRWSSVYDMYVASPMEMGTFSVVEVEPSRRVVSMITQADYRKDPADKTRYVSYDALATSLEALRDALENGVREGRGPYSVGVPYLLSSDRAGGAWPVVEALIQSTFAGSSIPLFIVELPPKALHA